MIQLKDATKVFDEKSRMKVLNQVNLKIEKGEKVAVMGRSGSGKTTLLNALAGLLRLNSGMLYFDGQLIDYTDDKALAVLRYQHMGFVFQNAILLPERTNLANIQVSIYKNRGAVKGLLEKEEALFSGLGIGEILHKYPDEISGGEAQRVSIARALVKKPKVIFADEPTGALDLKTEEGVMEILLKNTRTLVVATHSHLVAEKCQRIIRINDGQIED